MIIRRLVQLLGHTNWIRFGVRDQIIRAFHDPDTCEPEEFVAPFFGARYSGNFDTFIDWSVYYFGAYAREELDLIRDFLSAVDARHSVFLDIGANVGNHTLFAALHARRVLAFEPFPVVGNKLKQKIAENSLSNVELCEFALGDRNEVGTYSVPRDHNTGTGTFADSSPRGETLRLQIRVGDEVMVERRVEAVHCVKIDTEGFEPRVLRGLSATIARYRPCVFFEWSQRSSELAGDTSDLFPPGYVIYQFIAQNVVLGLFRSQSYRLSKLSTERPWPESNLFAVPSELVERLVADARASRAGEQLARARDPE